MDDREKFGRKLGEVHAFATLGLNTFEKAQASLTHIFGEDQSKNIIKDQQTTVRQIEDVATTIETIEVTQKKSEQTVAKLGQMRDLYIGDEWENPTELAEWLGFFEGAATVHWALIEGFALKSDRRDLVILAQSQQLFHEGILDEIKNFLRQLS